MNPVEIAAEQRTQDACLRYHGWTREDAPKGAIHQAKHCKFCEGYVRGFTALITERDAALVALRTRSLDVHILLHKLAWEKCPDCASDRTLLAQHGKAEAE